MEVAKGTIGAGGHSGHYTIHRLPTPISPERPASHRYTANGAGDRLLYGVAEQTTFCHTSHQLKSFCTQHPLSVSCAPYYQSKLPWSRLAQDNLVICSFISNKPQSIGVWDRICFTHCWRSVRDPMLTLCQRHPLTGQRCIW